ncbi:hypothetical protein ACFWCA_19155 [Streptomyces phaeochromogenes]|uniref:hypothetical protein n=1 Tax=Streptomyces phaeochromogenes TaxID=1923 RepID=UPI0036CCEF38
MTTITPDPVLTAAAVARLASVWKSVATAEEVGPVISCVEADTLAAVFLAVGDKDSAKAWISEHSANDPGCEGHDEGHDEEPLMSTTTVVHALTCTACGSNGVQPAVREWANCTNCNHGMSLSEAMTCGCDGYDCVPRPAAPYAPEPGEEYTYPLSDYARATARALGAGWDTESSYLGAWGLIFTTDVRVSLRLYVDGEGSTGDPMIQDRHTGDEYLVPAERLPEGAPRTKDEMHEWGKALALFVLSLGL